MLNAFFRGTNGFQHTFFTNIVSPWYLKGLENSIHSALSLLIVRAATIRSAFPAIISPTIPFQRLVSEPLTCCCKNGKAGVNVTGIISNSHNINRYVLSSSLIIRDLTQRQRPREAKRHKSAYLIRIILHAMHVLSSSPRQTT